MVLYTSSGCFTGGIIAINKHINKSLKKVLIHVYICIPLQIISHHLYTAYRCETGDVRIKCYCGVFVHFSDPMNH